MKKSINKEAEKVRTKKIEIEIPEGLCDFMERVCKLQGESVNDYLINSLVVVLDGDLDMHLSDLLDPGVPPGSNQRAYIESLAWPEEAAQEVYA